MYGGTGGNSHSDLPPDDLPERLECGTLNLPGIAGLQAAVQFLQRVGMHQVRATEKQLVKKIIDGLNSLEAVTVYGPVDLDRRGSAISFNIKGYDPAEVGFLLDQRNVCVRAGLHCAPDAHRTIGTYPQGTVRVSPGLLTAEVDIEQFIARLDSLLRQKS